MSADRFSADWLSLREAEDGAARDYGLVRRFAASLPRHPRLIDLGAGTGGNARALAPFLTGDQHWLLVESDPTLLATQTEATLAWASRTGRRAVRDGAEAIVETEGGTWRFRPLALDLAEAWEALDPRLADGATAAAFFDLAGAAWIERFARRLAAARVPLLAALTVDGRRHYRPADPDDGVIDAAFRRDQARAKGLGPALGPDAPDVLARALAAAGYGIVQATSDWRLGAASGALLGGLVAGEAAAARAAAPEAAARIALWERRRIAAHRAGTLEAVIGHRDLLALPPGICENPRIEQGGTTWPAHSGTAR